MQRRGRGARELDGLPAVGRERRAARSRGRVDRRAASAWRSRPRTSARASAPRSSSPSLPHLLRLRNPQRDTVLYPAVAYPSYEMGAVLAGCRAVPVPLDADWHLDLDAIGRGRRRAGAAALGERARQPDVVGGRRRGTCAGVAAWARRARHRRGQRRVLRRVRAAAGDDPRERRSTACSRCTACRSVRTSRACASASTRATPSSSTYLVETRKHAGLMAPMPMQAAAVAALGDDAHVAVQRGPLRGAPARSRIDALAPLGLVHDGGPCLVLPLAARDRRRRRRLGDRRAARARGRPARRARRSLRRRAAPITCGSRSCSPAIASSSRSTASRARAT